MKDLRRGTTADHDALVALQNAAYAQNAVILGATPLPLQADYGDILRNMEVWLIESGAQPDGAQLDGAQLDGALVLEFRAADMLIWSIASHPRARGAGIGRRLLDHAQLRAREERRDIIRLYTAEVLIANIEWYGRNGFAIESREQLADRTLVNMVKKTAF